APAAGSWATRNQGRARPEGGAGRSRTPAGRRARRERSAAAGESSARREPRTPRAGPGATRDRSGMETRSRGVRASRPRSPRLVRQDIDDALRGAAAVEAEADAVLGERLVAGRGVVLRVAVPLHANARVGLGAAQVREAADREAIGPPQHELAVGLDPAVRGRRRDHPAVRTLHPGGHGQERRRHHVTSIAPSFTLTLRSLTTTLP